ncbi:AAA family ATPase [Amycolatopsis sp. NPDC004378]
MIRDSRIERLLDTDRPVLLAMVGPAGAGKSTWRLRNVPSLPMVSIDTCRKVVSPYHDEADQAPETTARAVELAFGLAGALLSTNRSMVWDATNCEAGARKLLLELAAEHDAVAVAVVILPPLAICLEQNAPRNAIPGACGFARRVPDAVIDAMHSELVADFPALPDEGWDSIVVADGEGLPRGAAGANQNQDKVEGRPS